MHTRFSAGSVALFALLLSLSTSQAAQSPEERFAMPAPTYPFLVYGDTHAWTAQVAFNERGDATEAVIIHSTGSAQLDNTITKWIKTHWKSLGGKPATLVTSGK